MLLKMQDKMRGWMAYALVTIVCLSFALWGVQSYLRAGSGGNAVLAKVGSFSITQQLFQKRFTRYRRAYEAKRGALPESMVPEFKRIVLDRMVKEQAFDSGLRHLGLAYSEEQVTNAIQGIPAFQVDGAFSSERLAAYLQQSSQSIDQFAHNVGAGFIQQQFQKSMQASAISTPLEINRYGLWVTEKRAYDYVIFDPKKLHVPAPTEKHISDYYKANAKQFVRPRQISIEYLQLSPKALVAAIDVPSQDVSMYYEENKANFRSPTEFQVLQLPVGEKGQLAEVAAQKAITQGASLSALIAKYKGKASWLPYSQLAAEIQAKFASLSRDEAPLLLTVSGHSEWVQVLGKRPGKVQPLSAVTAKIENQLKSQRASREVAKKEDELINQAYIHPKSLAPAAKALGLTLQTSDYFAKTGGKGVLADPALLKSAWSESVQMAGNNSNVIHLADGSVLVLRLKAKRPEKTLPLKAVRADIAKVLLAKSRETHASLLSMKVAALTKQTKDAKHLSALLGHYGVKWVHETGVLRRAKVAFPEVRDKAFVLSKGGAQAMVLRSGESVVVWLKGVTSLPNKALRASPAYPSFAQEVERSYSRLFGLALIESVVSGVSVDVKVKAFSGKSGQN